MTLALNKNLRNREGKLSRFSFVGVFLGLTAFLQVACEVAFSEDTKAPPPLRIAVVKPLSDLAKAWGTTGSLAVHIREFDLEAALRQVAGGACDFALIRGDLSPGQERVLSKISGLPPDIETVAWEAITPIVHPNNPTAAMEVSDLSALLGDSHCLSATASLETWRDVGAEPPLAEDYVHLVLPAAGHPGAELLQSKVLDRCPFKEGLRSFSSDAAIERDVAADPASLGFVHRLRYIGLAKILPLKIEGDPVALTPNPESLRSGKYPLAQRIRFVAAKQFYFPHPAAKYLKHAQSNPGQLEVQRLGYFPIK